jgi:hypothetical protein
MLAPVSRVHNTQATSAPDTLTKTQARKAADVLMAFRIDIRDYYEQGDEDDLTADTKAICEELRSATLSPAATPPAGYKAARTFRVVPEDSKYLNRYEEMFVLFDRNGKLSNIVIRDLDESDATFDAKDAGVTV